MARKKLPPEPTPQSLMKDVLRETRALEKQRRKTKQPIHLDEHIHIRLGVGSADFAFGESEKALAAGRGGPAEDLFHLGMNTLVDLVDDIGKMQRGEDWRGPIEEEHARREKEEDE